MKKWMITAAIFCLLLLSTGISAAKGNGIDFSNFDGRAVSLKILQQKLNEYHGKRTFPKEFIQLCSINRILGYVVDDANQDIILLGEVDQNLPDLYLEDFVIALRNAWLKYAELKGNTYIYSYPACTIDPNPKVIQELDNIGTQIMGNDQSGEVEKAIKQWEKICKSPQEVGVFGIPFHTHFGWVMVKADYDAKRLVDGYDMLNIPGFQSLMDIELEQAKNNIKNGKPVSISTMNRFEFYPGKNHYLEDEGIVVIDKCEVKLLTEEEYLSRKGKIKGKGRANPNAQRFAKKFTQVYPEIAKQKPIYSKLENLFRFVALAKILKFKSSHEKAGLNIENLLEYMLEQYPVLKKEVKEYLPGRSNVKRFEHRKEYQGGSSTYRLWLPTCGGVSINIDVTGENFEKPRSKQLKEIKNIVLTKRPSSSAISWTFKQKIGKPGTSLINRQEIQRLNNINQLNSKNFITLIIRDQTFHYNAYFDSTKPFFKGNDKAVLLKKLKKIMERYPGTDVICLVLKGFTRDKAKLFEYSLQYQVEKENLKVFIIPIFMPDNSKELHDIFLSPLPNKTLELPAKSEPKIVEVAEGKYKGWFGITINFLVRLGNKTKKVGIRVFSRVKEVLIQFYRLLREILSADPSAPLIEDINKVLREIRKQHKAKTPGEIKIDIIDQVIDIDLGFLRPPYITPTGKNPIIKTAA